MAKNSNDVTYVYHALHYEQREKSSKAPTFLLFHAPADEIMRWADVDRLDKNNTKGAQRPLRDLKVRKIANFFQKNERNTIPTAVIVALDMSSATIDDDLSSGCVTLNIKVKGDRRPGLIIDGQHRVFGAAKFSGSTRLNIIAFSGGDDAERAFQFVVINNSATKVSRDHIKALNLQFDQNLLNERLLQSAGVALGLPGEKFDDLQFINSDGPFKGLLAFPTNNAGFIPPNAIEGALAEARDRAALLNIEDLERDFFLAVWDKIKKLYPNAWKKGSVKSQNNLLKKVSIQSLTTYILENLEVAQRVSDEKLDFTEEEILSVYMQRIVGRIPEEFWTSTWTSTQLDTSSGRQTLLEAIKSIDSNVRNDRVWYDRVSLIDPALLSGQAYNSSSPKKRKPKQTS